MINENIVVKTPTKEDWKKVVQCVLDNGNKWCNGDTAIHEEWWDSYNKEESCINVSEGAYGGLDFYQSTSPYSSFTIMTAQEFLDKYGTGKETRFKNCASGKTPEMVKPETHKIMDIVKFAKCLTLSKEEKLLRSAGLKDDNGYYTFEAREIVKDLEAVELGYKDSVDMCHHILGDDVAGNLSFLEYDALFRKHADKLKEIAEAKRTEDKKK